MDDIARSVMNAIKDQLTDYLDSYIMKSNRDIEGDWIHQEPWETMKFEYEAAEFTFLQLCNMVEMFYDDKQEQRFYNGLTGRLKERLKERRFILSLRHRDELEPDYPDQQRILNHELEAAV